MEDATGKKLFAVYLGGSAEGCNIEVHDVVFAVGGSIEETYPLLVKKWFGRLKGLHIDSYIQLQCIDNYQIELSRTPPKDGALNKLYFINFGAYKPGEFTEHHQSAFYVAKSSPDAIKRARSELCQGLDAIHKDDMVVLDQVSAPLDYDVDDVLEIREVDSYYICLHPAKNAKRPRPVSAYLKLDNLALVK